MSSVYVHTNFSFIHKPTSFVYSNKYLQHAVIQLGIAKFDRIFNCHVNNFNTISI